MYCSKKNHEQLIPLIGAYDESKIIAWVDGQAKTYADFLADVSSMAGRLPDNKYIFNLCEDRYLFMVVFAAVISNAQTNLLPPSKKAGEILDIARDYSDCCYVAEADYAELPINKLLVDLEQTQQAGVMPPLPLVEKDHLAVVIFTSGSTGHASKNLKTWHELVEGIRHFQDNMGVAAHSDLSIVATVPPQHMYGLETSILLPLLGGVSVSASKPFYPEDIFAIITDLEQPVVLVTTPLQLKACAYSGLDWTGIELVICSTAPLAPALAAEAEQAMHTRVVEIYGSTETGAIASRRTSAAQEWTLFDGYQIDSRRNLFVAGHLAEPVALNDHVLLLGTNKFKLMGRKSDLIKIAGKRGSIGDLNSKLRSIAGVEDGVFIYPEDESDVTGRLVALVVAPQLTEQEISRKLSELIDPVFLPRPLVKVAALPYTETNKLRRSELLSLYQKTRQA